MAKTPPPISLKTFLEKATPLEVTMNGQQMTADPKSFSTGSFGWNINGKMTVNVDGKPISVQIGLNLTVVGSKEAPRE